MRGRKVEGSDAVANVNISPLIDMVFILLIFFIVTTVFVEETGMALRTPAVSTVEPLNLEPFVIRIQANGALVFEKEELGVGKMKRIVADEKSRQNRKLTLEVEHDARTGRLVRVMDACLLAGASDVSVRSVLE